MAESTLNPAQRQAITHTGSPLIVLAGPGTGKTSVIIERVAHAVLERGLAPESIVAVTFTVKAAEQLRGRLHERLGKRAQDINAHTFHGFGLRLLRRFPGEVPRWSEALPTSAITGRARGMRELRLLDSAQARGLIRQIILDHGLFADSRGLGLDSAVQDVRAFRERLENHGISPAGALDRAAKGRAADARSELDETAKLALTHRWARVEELARAVQLFERRLRGLGLVSYGDLITLPTQMLGSNARVRDLVRDEFRMFVVDEFQDVNPAQIALLQACAPPSSGVGTGRSADLCVVGDDDQSIYGFRGADDRAFARFEEIWPSTQVVQLQTNYRSAKGVVALGQSIIQRASARFRPDKRIAADAMRDAAIRAAGPAPMIELMHLTDELDDAAAISAWLLVDQRMQSAATSLGTSARWTSYAVIARNNSDLQRVARALELEEIPFRIMDDKAESSDAGVARVLAMMELMSSPAADASAMLLLLRPPMSVDAREVQQLLRRYRASLSSAKQPKSVVENQPVGGGFVEWLEKNAEEVPQVRKLSAWLSELHRIDATEPADKTLERIVQLTEAVHADLLPGRQRAARVRRLVSMLAFVRERVDRLEPPRDIRALWRYLEDLDDRDRDFGMGSIESGIDEPDDATRSSESEPNAVTLLTAHRSKGLEFDTVLIPRVSPANGFPNTKSSTDPLDLPAGLFGPAGQASADSAVGEGVAVVQTDVSRKQRQLDEERRVFYVACTRAERRVVLLAKKNKSRSTSMHFVEELLAEPLPKESGAALVTGSMSELFDRAASLGVGSVRSPWRGSGDGVGAESAPAGSERAVMLDRARRLARAEAAAALDHAEHRGAHDPEALRTAIERLAGVARCLAILDEPMCDVGSQAVEGDRSHELSRLGVDDELVKLVDQLTTQRIEPVSGPTAMGKQIDDAAWLAGASSAPIPARASSESFGPGAAFAALCRQVAPGPAAALTTTFSQLKSYIHCPRCYLVERLGLTPPSGDPSRLIGTTIHRVLQEYAEGVRSAEADGTAPPALALLPARAEELLRDAWPSERELDASVLEQVRAQSQTAAEKFLISPSGVPTSILEVERDASITLGEHTLKVRFDRIDRVEDGPGAGELRIIDYKTGADSAKLTKPKPDDLQLGTYTLALREMFEEGVTGQGEYWVLSTGDRGVLRFEAMKLDRVESQLKDAIAGILSGRFTRSSARGAGYPHVCDILGELGST